MTRGSRLRRHPSRRVPAIVCALVLLCIGAALAAAGIGRLSTGRPPAAFRTVVGFFDRPWDDAFVLAASVIAALLGVLLVITAVIPGRRNALLLQHTGDDSPGEAVMAKRAVERLVAARARLVDGVDRVSVAARERVVRVDASTPTRYTSDVREQLRRNVEETLTATEFRRLPRTRITVEQK